MRWTAPDNCTVVNVRQNMCIKNSFLVDKGIYRLILLRRASFLLMVDTLVVICFSHDNLWSIIAPNSLSDVIFSNVSLFITIERFLWFSVRECCFLSNAPLIYKYCLLMCGGKVRNVGLFTKHTLTQVPHLFCPYVKSPINT